MGHTSSTIVYRVAVCMALFLRSNYTHTHSTVFRETVQHIRYSKREDETETGTELSAKEMYSDIRNHAERAKTTPFGQYDR